jgi:nitrogen fixation/metabolism regulation signal transduction histidine kinase
MASKPFYLKLLLYISLIGILALATSYLWLGDNKWFFIIPLITLFSVLSSLIGFLNRTNKDLIIFFEALLNEDSSIMLNNTSSPGYEQLNNMLKKLSKTIRNERIENRIQEQFFKELIGHSSTGLLAHDEKGFVKIANPSICKLIGLNHLVSMKTLENRFPELLVALNNLVPGKPALFKHTIENMPVLLQIRTSEFLFGEKKYRLIALQNIKAELDEQEVESWQKLFRIMAHEIMNSVAPITSLAQTIGKELPESFNKVDKNTDIERIRQSATAIEEQGQLMMSFVEKYRKFYKIPDPVMKPINVEDWLSRFRILFHQEMSEKGIDFRVESDGKLKEFTADDNLISQVVINLLKNARQAVEEKDNAIVSLSIIRIDDQTRLSVSDNGSGINPEYADQIFVPFFTTRQGGNGIGLAISRQIILKHHGAITFTSEPGKGTRFFVSIPDA